MAGAKSDPSVKYQSHTLLIKRMCQKKKKNVKLPFLEEENIFYPYLELL